MITDRLAKKTNNFEEAEKEFAYMIFTAEKEFNVGLIDESFPMMKLWNLFDEDNLKRFNDINTPGESKKGLVATLG